MGVAPLGVRLQVDAKSQRNVRYELYEPAREEFAVLANRKRVEATQAVHALST